MTDQGNAAAKQRANPYAQGLALASLVLAVLGLLWGLVIALISVRPLAAAEAAGPLLFAAILAALLWLTVRAITWRPESEDTAAGANG